MTSHRRRKAEDLPMSDDTPRRFPSAFRGVASGRTGVRGGPRLYNQLAGRGERHRALACFKKENADLSILDALGLEVIRALRAAVGFQVPAAELTNSRLFALDYQSPLSAPFARDHT